MEPEGSLLHSQAPDICTYPEPEQSNPPYQFLKIYFNIILPSTPKSSEWSPSLTCITRFNIQKFYAVPIQCICVVCGSENKQLLFPYTALTDWFV
jgi:hypothetical protein